MSRTISHYELQEELGHGGMAESKIVDTSLNRTIVY